MAEALLAYETIDASQIDAIMEGRRPGPPADWAKSGRTLEDRGGPAPGSLGGPMPQT
jgi:cell division protease FtsH